MSIIRYPLILDMVATDPSVVFFLNWLEVNRGYIYTPSLIIKKDRGFAYILLPLKKIRSGYFQQPANNKEISYEKMGLYSLWLCS